MKAKERKVIGDVKEFEVDRKKWFRGNGSDVSSLLTENNKMCCLGFYAKSCGLARKDIFKASSPENVVSWKTKLVKDHANSPKCNEMMEVNDDISIDDKEREKKLTSLFKRLGIKVKFK